MTGLLGPRSTGREVMWAVMREKGDGFTAQGVAQAARESVTAVADYVKGLRRAGIIEATGTAPSPSGHPGAYPRMVYRIARDVGVDAPRVRRDGTILPEMGRDRLWRVMRIVKEFSVTDLVVLASLPEAPVAESEAECYCLWLTRAGYLQELEPGRRYRFRPTQDTGPRAPMIRRIREVVDANTGEVRWSGDEREERP